MQKSLPPKTILLVKSTIPALAEHGIEIAGAMYERLFKSADIRALFNHANQGEGGSQVRALAGAVLAYAQNVDNLAALASAVERISQKHIGYDILPEHYPFVADALLGAMVEVLGDAATPEIQVAWSEAYWFLAEILKEREHSIRNEIESSNGGWTGWRKFVVAEKIRESEVITSFILRPISGESVLCHRPGRYLTFRFDAPGNPGQKRNYSISCGPNDRHYRISVKREANGHGGSRFFHDVVKVGSVLEITPPAGDFYLGEEPQRPVVLLSGGVGLTPMMSMLETIAVKHPNLETHYVHGTLSSATHAMAEHVKSLAQAHENIRATTFYSQPAAADVIGQTYDHSGFITIDWLKANTPLHEADVYLCGPKPFLRAFVNGLSVAGVSPDRVHYEFFGPADELLDA